MTDSKPVSISDQHQIPVIGTTSLHYNAKNELIWISYVYPGKNKWQQVTDTAYEGGDAIVDITRTKSFHNWEDL